MRKLRRIMLVEDDPDIALLATIALHDIAGFEVIHCASAEEALERVSFIAPDLAVLDFSLPGMNGDALLTALRANAETRNIVAVFMTASVMPRHVQRLKSLGAIEVFAKPFDPLQLGAQITAAWARANCDQQT